MRKMKDSGVEWIGEIPENWDVTRFKKICSIHTGNSIKDEDKALYNDMYKSHPYISSKDIDGTFLVANYLNGVYIKNNDTSFKVAPVNSTLMCIEGGSAGKKKFSVQKEVSFVNKLCCFYSNTNNNKYIYYYLCSPNYEKEFQNNITGLIGGVSVSVLKNFSLPIPPLETQERIADYLDQKCEKIDAILAGDQRAIDKLKEYKLSLITEKVTKGLDPTVPMKDSGVEWIGEIPEGWEVRKLLSLLDMRVIDGPHESPKLYDEGIPFISANAIENNRINFEKKRGYISKKYSEECSKKYTPKVDDILMIKLGATTGQIAIVTTNRKFNIWVPLAAIRSGDSIIPKYLFYTLQSFNILIQTKLNQTFGTQETLGVKTIEKFRILLPSLDEQQAIADYLDQKCAKIDAAIESKEKLIEKLTEYKKSLIYEVVTGKKEV